MNNFTKKVLNSKSYTKFLKNAADDRSFNALSDHKKKKERGLMYKRPTPEMHEVQRTPPPKSPGQFNMTKVKNTPGGSRVLRSKRGLNYRLPITGSPLPFEKSYKRRKTNSSSNSSNNNSSYSPKSPLKLGKKLFDQFRNMKVTSSTRSMHTGGLVRKTGPHRLLKNEIVLSRSQRRGFTHGQIVKILARLH